METMTIKPRQTRTKMSKEELAQYMNETRKSCHVFKNKKKYDRRRFKNF